MRLCAIVVSLVGMNAIPIYAQACLGGPTSQGLPAVGFRATQLLEGHHRSYGFEVVGWHERGAHIAMGVDVSDPGQGEAGVRFSGELGYALADLPVQLCPIAGVSTFGNRDAESVVFSGGVGVGGLLSPSLGAFLRGGFTHGWTDDGAISSWLAMVGAVGSTRHLNIVAGLQADPERPRETTAALLRFRVLIR